MIVGKLLDTMQNILEAVAEVVHNDHVVARFQELQAGVRSDITESADDQDEELIVSRQTRLTRARMK
jgi:4-hydroxy-3-methylbut-2-enyl diphosphate reductase IspH